MHEAGWLWEVLKLTVCIYGSRNALMFHFTLQHSTVMSHQRTAVFPDQGSCKRQIQALNGPSYGKPILVFLQILLLSASVSVAQQRNSSHKLRYSDKMQKGLRVSELHLGPLLKCLLDDAFTVLLHLRSREHPTSMPDSHLDKYTCMRSSKYIQRKILDYHPTKEGGCKFLCVVPGVGTAQGELKSLLSSLISIQ